MPIRPLLAGAALAFGLTSGAFAAIIIDGSQPDAILEIARAYGTAQMATEPPSDPRIAGETGGRPYHVFFLNCPDGGSCEDLNFYAAFPGAKPTMDALNAWNRDKRFGNAYLDSDLDAILEFDVNIDAGVTQENLDADFSLWSLMLGQFAEYVAPVATP